MTAPHHRLIQVAECLMGEFFEHTFGSAGVAIWLSTIEAA